MMIILKQKKRKFKPRIKLNHNIYIDIYKMTLRSTAREKYRTVLLVKLESK